MPEAKMPDTPNPAAGPTGDWLPSPVDEILAEFYARMDELPLLTSAEELALQKDLLERHPEHVQELRQRLDGRNSLRNKMRGPEKADEKDLPPGTRFDGYEIVRSISQGGMGIVYLAKQVPLEDGNAEEKESAPKPDGSAGEEPTAGREVAIKFILQSEFPNAKSLARFYNEAEIIANFKDPHIVTVYGFGRYEGRPYYSMEYVAGGTLQALIRAGRPTPQRAAELMLQIARGVMYAHGRSVLHRDLKTANVLLTNTGDAKVTDFGLAKRFVPGADLTADVSYLGTPAYMSPEQVQGLSKQATTHSDIYSLGVVLYELLTGKLPFFYEKLSELRHAILHEDPQWPAELEQEIPLDLRAICLKCMQKKPEDRYETAAALAEDLENYLKGEPISARLTTTPERVVMWCRQNPLVASLSAIVAIVIAIAVGIGMYSWQRAEADLVVVENERNRANFFTYATQIRSAWHALEAGDLLEAKRLLEVCESKERGWEHNLLAQAVEARIKAMTAPRDLHAWRTLAIQQDPKAKPVSLDFHAATRDRPLSVTLRQIDLPKDETPAPFLEFRITGMPQKALEIACFSIATEKSNQESVTTRKPWVALRTSAGHYADDKARWAAENAAEQNGPEAAAFEGADDVGGVFGVPGEAPTDEDLRTYCWTDDPTAPQVVEWGYDEVKKDDGKTVMSPRIPVDLAWHPTKRWLTGVLPNGVVLNYDPNQRKTAIIYEPKNKNESFRNVVAHYAPTGDLIVACQREKGEVDAVVLESSDSSRDSFAFDHPLSKLGRGAFEMAGFAGFTIQGESLGIPLLGASSDGRLYAVATRGGRMRIGELYKSIEKDGTIYSRLPYFSQPVVREVLLGCWPTALIFGSQEEVVIGDSDGWISVWRPTYVETKEPNSLMARDHGDIAAWSQKLRVRVSSSPIQALAMAGSDQVCICSALGELSFVKLASGIVAGELDFGGIPTGWIPPSHAIRLDNGASRAWNFATAEQSNDMNMSAHRHIAWNSATNELWSVNGSELHVKKLEGGLSLEPFRITVDPSTSPQPLDTLEYNTWQHRFTFAWSFAPTTRRIAHVWTSFAWLTILDVNPGGLLDLAASSVDEERKAAIVKQFQFANDPPNWPMCCVFTPDGTRLLIGTWGGAVRILDITSMQWLPDIRGAKGPIYRIDLDEYGDRFCAIAMAEPGQVKQKVGDRFEAHFGRVSTGKYGTTLELTRRGAFSSLMSHDGKRFFTSPREGSVVVYDTAYGYHLGNLAYNYTPPATDARSIYGDLYDHPLFSLSHDSRILTLLYENKTLYWRCERK